MGSGAFRAQPINRLGGKRYQPPSWIIRAAFSISVMENQPSRGQRNGLAEKTQRLKSATPHLSHKGGREKSLEEIGCFWTTENQPYRLERLGWKREEAENAVPQDLGRTGLC